jgi:2-polyprenyl-3-methyl-5-hydroxy-6-metoxy-1,4-benzoquinol methylase
MAVDAGVDLIDPTSAATENTHATALRLCDPPGGRVVDIGAGGGNFTTALELAGYDVVAIDVDSVDYVHSTAPFIEHDVDSGALPFEDSSLRGLVTIEVLEHLETPLRLLRDIARVLEPGGWCVLTTPNVLSLNSRIELLVRGHPLEFSEHDYRSNGHVSPTSATQICFLAERCWMAVEEQTYNLGRVPVPRLRRSVALRAER